uniref:Vertebrate ancient long opsin a n=1 Tax=Cyprinus carpio TaxID=7962 RepID=A0A8C1YL28_CYPCA
MESFEAAVNGVSHSEDPFSGPLTSIAPWNYRVLAALMFVVTAVSLCENFTVMLVTFRFKQLRQPLNYIIVNLSLADFLVSLSGGTISFVTNYHGYFFLGRWACVLEGFAVTFFGIVALWSLAVLAFERFFVICRPLGNIRLRGKHAALGLLFVWTFSFIWTIPPVLGWSSYTVSKIGTTCEPNWYSGNVHDHTFIITFFTTCFILPLGVIIVCYCKLLRKLRKVSRSTTPGVQRLIRRVFIEGFVHSICLVYITVLKLFIRDCRCQFLSISLKFRKCVVQLLSCSDVTVIEGNINQTTERAGMTNESNTGEMSAIAGTVRSKTEEHPNERSSCPQIPIPENKVCPM